MGRWTRPTTIETRLADAMRLATLLHLGDIPLVPDTILTITGRKQWDDLEGAEVALPGLMSAQAVVRRPICILVDESGLEEDPWGVPGRGPSARIVQDILDLSQTTRDIHCPVVRVPNGPQPRGRGAFGLGDGLRLIRQATPLQVDARTVADALHEIRSAQPPGTWEGPP